MRKLRAPAVAIDIGGTNIKAGLVSADGEIIRHLSVPTDEAAGADPLLENICWLVNEMAAEAERRPVGIGIGTPGFVNPEQGVVTDCPGKIPGWTGTHVAEYVSERSGLPALLDNDAKVIALGEGWVGAAQDVENFISLTLGTGVGGAIVLGGQLLQGPSFTAGALGHVCLDPEGPKCICGSNGCLESYVSTRAIGAAGLDYIMRGVETAIPDHVGLEGEIDARAVFEAAAAGDAVAKEIVDRIARRLGAAIVSFVHVLDLEVIVIGGGVAKAG